MNSIQVIGTESLRIKTRRRRMIEKIRTYLGRSTNVRGEIVHTIKPAYRCTVCGKIFLNQQEGDEHGKECKESND